MMYCLLIYTTRLICLFQGFYYAWFESTIPTCYEVINQPLENFLTSVGRRKFLTPLYKALVKADTTGEKARNNYTKARLGYHSVAVQSIDDITEWKTNTN